MEEEALAIWPGNQLIVVSSGKISAVLLSMLRMPLEEKEKREAINRGKECGDQEELKISAEEIWVRLGGGSGDRFYFGEESS